MFWPIVIVLALASNSPIGMTREPKPEGYQTTEDCLRALPALTQLSQSHPWPMPFDALAFASACIDMPPQEFFEQYIYKPTVVEYDI